MGFGSRNCGHCSGIGTVSKRISNNLLTCTCRVCGRGYPISLPDIKKKIIYLDQNFFSNAYKGKQEASAFLERFERICLLAKKQLIICPYSDIHDIETHLCKYSKELFEFIRAVSRGKRFNLSQEIEEQQLINSYIAYLESEQKAPLNLLDAITPDVHNWDESLRINIDWSIANHLGLSVIRQDKKNFTNAVIDALPMWRKSTSSLEDDFNLEIKDNARILENQNYGVVSSLLSLESGGDTFEQRFQNIKKFLLSKCFSSTPHVNISAGLWALVKEEIRQKQFLTELSKKDKIKKEVQGLVADIKHLSVFAPYCDAIFTERRMARLLKKWQRHPLGGFNFEIFSTNNWGEFDNYLDKLENSCTAEMQNELEIAYGG